ncbi:hypothetical protein CEXT_211861 [Caerostris extrusa]|uniref:C2H2-type domain-containing protein n=1 Tax=Caerostris extrusa TaxID=172846 RepID=A0AAV4PM49_CAEEX|nr:hypothetical protein CEXT_211861 [Caerostris extrusa]
MKNYIENPFECEMINDLMKDAHKSTANDVCESKNKFDKSIAINKEINGLLKGRLELTEINTIENETIKTFQVKQLILILKAYLIPSKLISRKMILDQTVFLNHISIHEKEDLDKCCICNIDFDDSDQLQAHLQTHSNIPIKDINKIVDEDIELDFAKFEEVFSEDIDKIGLDGDFDEKIDTMYPADCDNSSNCELIIAQNNENDKYL